MQAQITGGRIFYGRTVKVSDFEPKRAEVELTFGAPEGAQVDEALVDAIGQRVVAKVHEMLGLSVEKSNVVALRPAATNGATQPTDKDRLAAQAGLPADAKTETKAGDPPPPTTKTTRKKPPAVAAGGDPAEMGGEAAPKTNGAASADPAAIDGDAGSKVDAAEVSDDDLLMGSAPEVTDEALTTAITKKNAAVKNPVAIRQLIGRYTPQDGNAHQAREIEQAKRAAFITELDTIKPLI